VKKIIAIFLVFAIAFQVCSKLVVAGWFSINQKELTELFCVNKQTPSTHCDGKCYLNKKLKETDQDTQQGSTVPVKHKSATEEVWFCEQTIFLTAPASNHILQIAVSPNHYNFQAHHTIFQPPRA
jgi:hypothetical protein